MQLFNSVHGGGPHHASLKSARSDNKLSWTPYMADKLRPADEQNFCSAGVLLLHRNSHGQCQVLLGKQKGRLTFLGGMRNTAETSTATAARELAEESADQLVLSLRRLSARGTAPVDSHFTANLVADCPVIWLGGTNTNSKYALYIMDIAARISQMPSYSHLEPQLSTALDSLPADFLGRRQGLLSALWSSSRLEMQSLHWIQLHKSQVLTAASKDMSAFLAKVVAECQPLQQWAANVTSATALPSLQHNIQAAQKAARQEEPALRAAISSLTVPTAPIVQPTAPSDLVSVPPGSREFMHIQSLCKGRPLHEIKRVVVPGRQARFEAWKRFLPVPNRDITQVSLHFCMLLTNATSNHCTLYLCCCIVL